MGNHEVAISNQDHGTTPTTNNNKRKTPLQLQTLENLYSDNDYPTKKLMEDYAAALGLTYKQVRGWFIERRRREKKENGMAIVASTKKLPGGRRNGVGFSARKILKKRDPRRAQLLELDIHNQGHNKHCSRNRNTMVDNSIVKRKKRPICLQDDIFSPDYILKKVFRKDGPPLGVEFDSLPSTALCHGTDSRKSHHACQEIQREAKRRKVLKPAALDIQVCKKKSAPVKKHGIGKGLMTVWRLTNPDAGDFPTGVGFAGREATGVFRSLTSISRKPLLRAKRSRKQLPLMTRLRNKLQDKRKPPIKRRKVECNKNENQKQPHREKCELALEGVRSQGEVDQFAMLVDDEELELRELQAGPNPLTCSAHFGTNGLHGCSFCKDLLAKFPPNSVKMKQPFCMQPWDSSPELVKKLFKVFHFLYTYAVTVDICPFTLDEFAQAFHDKDSLLLGKVHVALLKFLLSDVEMELSSGFLPHVNKNCKFLALLHSVSIEPCESKPSTINLVDSKAFLLSLFFSS